MSYVVSLARLMTNTGGGDLLQPRKSMHGPCLLPSSRPSGRRYKWSDQGTVAPADRTTTQGRIPNLHIVVTTEGIFQN